VKAGLEDAINTGTVILYGRIVEPPFLLSTSEDTLLLNGVRIDPPIMPPWEYKSADIEVTERSMQISELTKRIRARYAELLSDDEVGAQEQLLEWEGEFSMFLGEHRQRTDYGEVRQELIESTRNRYNASLMTGDLIAIGYGPVLTIPASQVDITLEQITETADVGSIADLAKLLHHKELAQEMLFLRDREEGGMINYEIQK
jgi:hypothetical protein